MNFIFPYVGNVIIPTDELIFFRGVGMPLDPRMSSKAAPETFESLKKASVACGEKCHETATLM